MSQWPSPPTPDADPSSGAPMAQCTVTGTWHPTGDLVTFQGQLVCAEGKRILLDRIMAGESPTFVAGRPTVLRRWGCLFLDGLILMIPMIILEIILFGSLIVSAPNQPGSTQDPTRYFMVSGLFSLIITIGSIAYFALLHARNGQTVGKKVGKLRVVNLDGTPISTRTAWIRALAYLGANLLVALATVLFASFLSLSAFITVNAIMSFAVIVWILADIILGLSDSQMQRTLHDRIAGTRVIYLGA